MKCGVRFCGGCNPRYDRGEIYQRLKSRFSHIQISTAEEGIVYDFLVVIGGCTNCCASYDQFTSRYGVVRIWEEAQWEDTAKAIEEIIRKNQPKESK